MTTTGTTFNLNYTIPKGTDALDLATITVMVTFNEITTRRELKDGSTTKWGAVLSNATTSTAGSITAINIPLSAVDGVYRIELVKDSADSLIDTSTLTTLSKGIIRKISSETTLSL